MSSNSLATVSCRVFVFVKCEQNFGMWEREYLASAHSPHYSMHSFPFKWHSKFCFLIVFLFIGLLIIFFVCFIAFVFFLLCFLLFFWNLHFLERRIGVDTELFR